MISSLELKFLSYKKIVETRRNNNQKVPKLENMIGMGVYPIQAAKAFGELLNLYEILHFFGKTLHFYNWSILTFSVQVNQSICQADYNTLHNQSSSKSNNSFEIPPNRQLHLSLEQVLQYQPPKHLTIMRLKREVVVKKFY